MTPINTSVVVTNTAQTVLDGVKVTNWVLTNDWQGKLYRKRNNSQGTLQPAVVGQWNVLNPWERIQLNNVTCTFSFICATTTTLLISYS